MPSPKHSNFELVLECTMARKHWLTWGEQKGKERWRGKGEDGSKMEVRDENWREGKTRRDLFVCWSPER